jgi:cholesterol transport system auxiliary component
MGEFSIPGKSNKQLLYVTFLLLLLCFFVLQGCANDGRPRPTIENYIIDYPVPILEKRAQLNETIRFNRFTIAAAYNNQNMIFRQDIYSIDSFNYNKWAVNPADMLADSLLRDMQASRLFRAVFSRYAAEEGRYIIQGGVGEFFLRIEKGSKTAVICLDITLKDSQQREATKRILFQKKYRQEESLKDQSPRGYCQAMSEAAQNISRQIITDVYQAIKSSANK